MGLELSPASLIVRSPCAPPTSSHRDRSVVRALEPLDFGCEPVHPPAAGGAWTSRPVAGVALSSHWSSTYRANPLQPGEAGPLRRGIDPHRLPHHEPSGNQPPARAILSGRPPVHVPAPDPSGAARNWGPCAKLRYPAGIHRHGALGPRFRRQGLLGLHVPAAFTGWSEALWRNLDRQVGIANEFVDLEALRTARMGGPRARGEGPGGDGFGYGRRGPVHGGHDARRWGSRTECTSSPGKDADFPSPSTAALRRLKGEALGVGSLHQAARSSPRHSPPRSPPPRDDSRLGL